jgi:hypothetical protein
MLHAMIAHLIGGIRPDRKTLAEPCGQSLRVLANRALRPRTKAWLAARAVSLRAF